MVETNTNNSMMGYPRASRLRGPSKNDTDGLIWVLSGPLGIRTQNHAKITEIREEIKMVSETYSGPFKVIPKI